jgi:hypothetical protein
MDWCLKTCLILYVSVFGNCYGKTELPRVNIQYPDIGELGPSDGIETEIQVTNGLVINCIAPYPVVWVIEKFEFGKVGHKVTIPRFQTW